jgi:hypothetical protein
MKILRSGLMSLGILLAGCAAHGQLVSWEIAGTNATITNPQAASSLAANIADASLTLGGGVTAASAADTFGGSGFNTTSLAAAISGDDYLSFTITPSAGYNLSIASISLLTGVSTAVTSFHGDLLSSATGFTASDSVHSYLFATTSAPIQSIVLSGFTALQNVSGPIEFRLYGWRDPAGTSTFRFRNLSGSDLVINGSAIAVPEPSTCAAMFGLVAFAWVAIRRRRLARSAWADGCPKQKARRSGGLGF